MSEIVVRMPGWVDGLLIPMLEGRVRAVVTEQVRQLTKTLNARIDGFERTLSTRIVRLEKTTNTGLRGQPVPRSMH